MFPYKFIKVSLWNVLVTIRTVLVPVCSHCLHLLDRFVDARVVQISRIFTTIMSAIPVFRGLKLIMTYFLHGSIWYIKNHWSIASNLKLLHYFQSEKAATPVSKSATPTSSGNTTPGPVGPGLKQGVLKAPHLGEWRSCDTVLWSVPCIRCNAHSIFLLFPEKLKSRPVRRLLKGGCEFKGFYKGWCESLRKFWFWGQN